MVYQIFIFYLFPCGMLHAFLMCAVLILHVQTHNVCEPQSEVEAEALAEEDTALEAEVEVAITEATVEPVVEALTTDEISAEAEPAAVEVVTKTVVESVEEVIAEIPELEQVIEAVFSPAAPEEDDAEIEVLTEDVPDGPAEPVTMTEVPH